MVFFFICLSSHWISRVKWLNQRHCVTRHLLTREAKTVSMSEKSVPSLGFDSGEFQVGQMLRNERVLTNGHFRSKCIKVLHLFLARQVQQGLVHLFSIRRKRSRGPAVWPAGAWQIHIQAQQKKARLPLKGKVYRKQQKALLHFLFWDSVWGPLHFSSMSRLCLNGLRIYPLIIFEGIPWLKHVEITFGDGFIPCAFRSNSWIEISTSIFLQIIVWMESASETVARHPLKYILDKYIVYA